MPRTRPVLAVLAVILAAVAVCVALLLGRSGSVDPELGPAVEVRLGPSASEPTPSSDRPSSTTPSSTTPSGGATTVPRHAPMPAGDDDDDEDDDDDDDDETDTDDDD